MACTDAEREREREIECVYERARGRESFYKFKQNTAGIKNGSNSNNLWRCSILITGSQAVDLYPLFKKLRTHFPQVLSKLQDPFFSARSNPGEGLFRSLAIFTPLRRQGLLLILNVWSNYIQSLQHCMKCQLETVTFWSISWLIGYHPQCCMVVRKRAANYHWKPTRIHGHYQKYIY